MKTPAVEARIEIGRQILSLRLGSYYYLVVLIAVVVCWVKIVIELCSDQLPLALISFGV